MKLSEQWLREWVNPDLTGDELGAIMTMSGLEVDAYTNVAEEFSDVVVALVVHVEKHPEADRLKVCEVNVGASSPLTLFAALECSPGLKLLQPCGARLQVILKFSKIRNVVQMNALFSSARMPEMAKMEHR